MPAPVDLRLHCYSGSGLRWILAGRQDLLLLLDPSLDQFHDSAIGGFVACLLQPVNISSDL